MLLEALTSILPSKTLRLAVLLVPILGRAFDLNKADDWIYGKLPDKVKEKGTLNEFEDVLKTGKAFLKAVYEFLHK